MKATFSTFLFIFGLGIFSLTRGMASFAQTVPPAHPTEARPAEAPPADARPADALQSESLQSEPPPTTAPGVPHTETTINVTLTVTPENYANVKELFLKACPAKLVKDGEKACDDLKDSAAQAMADEAEYIRVNNCDVPTDRPVPKQSEVHSKRFQDLFDSSRALANCSDAIYARDVLSKYWPFLAIMGISDACGFLKASKDRVASLQPFPTHGKKSSFFDRTPLVGPALSI